MDKPYGLTMRGIVKNSNEEILILRRHPKSRTNPHKWELPGGKVDPGELSISDEHDNWMWANLEKIKTLELSTAFEKVLKKKNWKI